VCDEPRTERIRILSVEDYLGDSVYATYDGNRIILDLRGQDDSKIYLDRSVLEALDRFRKEHGL